jgi:omega-amidase
MKITILQQDINWGDEDRNISEAQKAVEQHAGSQLYLLPEMWSTGFNMNPSEVAKEPEKSQALRWMRQTAKERNAAIGGSIAILEEGKYFNRFYLIKPDGQDCHYDKHHLFTYGGEPLAYTAGNQRVTTTYCNIRILLQTCYDIRFPVFQRNHEDYDLALFVANWPQSRQHAWETLLMARAIENQCYVAAVNRVGNDPACHYAGGSGIVSPYGDFICCCKPDKIDACTGEIDMEKLERFRAKFPVLKDADRQK